MNWPTQYVEPQRKNGRWVNSSFLKVPYPSEQKIVDFLSTKPQLHDMADVARLLQIPVGQLHHIVFNHKHQYYRIFEIPKKNGSKRSITSPHGSLDVLLHRLKMSLDYYYRPKKVAHGFIRGRNIKTNAEVHAGRPFILNFDLKDFYDSITFARLYGLFQAQPFSFHSGAAAVLANLCTYNQKLPQGACTSPVLSNLIASSLDRDLIALSKKYDSCLYSRYADDITFSFFKPTDWVIFAGKVKSVIERNGFLLNENKTRLQYASQRQEVTGLVVNRKVNIPRSYIMDTRTKIHHFSKDANEAAQFFCKKRGINCSHEEAIRKLKRHLYGRLSYLCSVLSKYSPIYKKLMKKMLEADKENNSTKKNEFLNSFSKPYQVFISHASEDRAVADKIYKALKEKGYQVFIDLYEIDYGDRIWASVDKGLAEANVFIPLISSIALDKDNVKVEIYSALVNDIARRKNKRIFPVSLIPNGTQDVLAEKLPLLSDMNYFKYGDSRLAELTDVVTRLLESCQR